MDLNESDNLVEKVVLDKQGNPFGLVKVPKKVKEIEAFEVTTNDGTPVNVRIFKLSSSINNFKKLQKNMGYELFTEYKFKGNTYYKF